MSEKIQVLFVDDEEKFLENMATRLRLRDLEVDTFNNGQEALDASQSKRYDVALLDLKMPGMDGEELLLKLKERDPSLEVIILTGHGSIKSAATLTKEGAYEYLLKPCDLDDVIGALSNAFAKRVKARNEQKTARVNTLMEEAVNLSPIELLRKLEELDRE